MLIKCRWVLIQIWTQFGKFSPPLDPLHPTLVSPLPMWVSSYASCEYHLTFHVSIILLFMWAPSYASQNRHLHHKQAIAPTIVWGLLTGLASSRRRRSAGVLLKCWNWLQWRRSQCEQWSTKTYFLWIAQAWKRFLLPETSPAFSIPLTKVET